MPIDHATKIERLQQLRRVVLEAPAERFHMLGWEDQAICGTVRCAVGWAGVDPWFTAQGFAIILATPELTLEDDAFSGWGAVEEFFDLSGDDADALFSGEHVYALRDNPHLITREMVVANIDRLIAGQEPIPYRVEE